MKQMDRRDFIKLTGAGLYVLFSTEEALFSQAPGNRAGAYPEDFNAYLRIAEDGKVTCYSGKVELGQGITASLAQMLAEELETPFESISMVFGDTKLCPWDGGTNGSRSIKYFGPALRAAGAEAREVLILLAAEHLRIAQDRLIAKNGFIVEKANPLNKVSYGALTKGKTIERHLEKKPELKLPSAFVVCGKSLPRADLKDKAMGKAKYAGDIRLPGMLYGKVLRPPAHGAKLKKVDVAGASAIEDARVFQEGDFIGVVHPLPDMAEKALSLIKAEYELPAAAIDDKNVHQRIIETAGRDNVVEQKGDLALGEKQASVKFENSYFTAYIAHAPLETHTAAANVEQDSATMWIGTQRPFGINQEIGRAIGMNADQIRIITPYVGGGFGGKSQVGQAVQAARLSKLAGCPVQVAWSREEEFFYDTFQPAAVVKIKSGIDQSNRITFWDYNVLFAGDRSSQNIYNVPHLRTTARGTGFGGGGPHPFPTGAWRGPGSNTNVFSRESHMDVMAMKAGIDPLEFRLKNLSDPRMVRVINAASEKFGWKPGKAPTGQGRGMACLDYLGTYVALMAKIKASKETGEIKVERIVCAIDMGPVINPEGARMQIEGCVMMGLGYCLSEEMHFNGGEIKDLGFDSYAIPRFSWIPEIEPVLVTNNDIAPSGCGEPPIVGMGALLANALFDAIGVRITQLPLTPARIRDSK